MGSPLDKLCLYDRYMVYLAVSAYGGERHFLQGTQKEQSEMIRAVIRPRSTETGVPTHAKELT